MSFLPQINPDGTPNISAAFVNALMIDSIYQNDVAAINAYCAIAGVQKSVLVRDPATYEPDYLILISGNDALIAFAGTTNAAQWIGHLASAIVPAIDTVVGGYVVASFYFGLGLREAAIASVLAEYNVQSVKITGHSYGGAAAYIYGRHVKQRQGSNFRVDVMTFGEPKSYGGIFTGIQPDTHNRLIATNKPRAGDVLGLNAVDCVALTPPNGVEMFCFGLAGKVFKFLTQAEWSHYGTGYLLGSNFIEPFSLDQALLFKIPWEEIAFFSGNALAAPLHYMQSSYLAKILSLYQS